MTQHNTELSFTIHLNWKAQKLDSKYINDWIIFLSLNLCWILKFQLTQNLCWIVKFPLVQSDKAVLE